MKLERCACVGSLEVTGGAWVQHDWQQENHRGVVSRVTFLVKGFLNVAMSCLYRRFSFPILVPLSNGILVHMSICRVHDHLL